MENDRNELICKPVYSFDDCVTNNIAEKEPKSCLRGISYRNHRVIRNFELTSSVCGHN